MRFKMLTFARMSATDQPVRGFAKLSGNAVGVVETVEVVCEAVWQYSHHVLHGLIGHEGPILTVANWSGQWPGLVGMLNLNGSLAKAGIEYSTLWSENFDDAYFLDKLGDWLETGKVKHSDRHVRTALDIPAPHKASLVATDVAAELAKDKAINLHGQDFVYDSDEQRFAVITEYLIFQLQIIDRLAARGAAGVIAGCTEIEPLLALLRERGARWLRDYLRRTPVIDPVERVIRRLTPVVPLRPALTAAS